MVSVSHITVQVLTFILGCNSLFSVLVVWIQLPAVLGVDVGWDAGSWLVKILASAKCWLRLLFIPQGEYRRIWTDVVVGWLEKVNFLMNNAVGGLLCCYYLVGTRTYTRLDYTHVLALHFLVQC
jgi:hypothetical protein